jgi:hypothetical protein
MRYAFAVWFVFTALVSAYGQNSTAKVTGTVSDISGAIVPGALVTLIDNETSTKVEGKANESGSYLISFLRPGPYSFTVEAPSMRRYVRALTLVSGQVLQLDVKLEVGQTAESVTVDNKAAWRPLEQRRSSGGKA